MGIKPNTELTSTERLALQKFHAWCEKHGAPPSVRKFADALGVSHSGAHNIMRSLRRKGFLGEGRFSVTVLRVSAKGRKEL